MKAIAPGIMNVVPQTLPCVTGEGGFLECSEDGPNKIDFNICFCLVIGNRIIKQTDLCELNAHEEFFEVTYAIGEKNGSKFLVVLFSRKLQFQLKLLDIFPVEVYGIIF